jgi:hypothetical protein
MTTLARAQAEGAIRINTKQNTVYYAHLGTSLPLNPEEQVRMQVYADVLYRYGYPPKRIVFEHPVKMGSSYKRVDILVFADDLKQKPFLIIECKKAGVGESTFEEAIEQAFSYDNHLYASYIWVSSGRKDAFFKAEHSKSGRKRYTLSEIPKFTWKDKVWYKTLETLQIGWNFLRDVYEEFVAPTLKAKWFAQLIFFAVIFLICNYVASWANHHWLTPYAIGNKWLNKITFEHLFWISGSLATLVAVWILRHSVVPNDLITASKAVEKAKQRNRWVLIATVLVLVPVYFWLKIFFDYDTKYCYKCTPCASDWRCWWSFAHFKTYTEDQRIWEYLTPSWVILGVQTVATWLVSWLLKGYAAIR